MDYFIFILNFEGKKNNHSDIYRIFTLKLKW